MSIGSFVQRHLRIGGWGHVFVYHGKLCTVIAPHLTGKVNFFGAARYTRGMEDSVFTKIIKGEIPCHKIYEDEHTFAFLDIFPACEGHTLVVHKRQAEFVWDLNDDEYQQLMGTAKKISRHYLEVSGKPYVKMSIVGTDVPHNHLHLLPFTVAAETHGPDREGTPPNHEALAKIAKKLRLDD